MKQRMHRLAGVALLEALIALAILAGALLALLYMQLRTQADTESTLRRAQAMHLIDDLAERIRTNPSGFDELASYRSDWGTAPSPAIDCQTQSCGPAHLAQWDLSQWKANVAQSLPKGDAMVFDPPDLPPGTPRRMLAVMVGWHIRSGDSFELAVPGASCPTGHACQFGHVQP
jgi:type IV pilus assembly protein PilV